MPNVTAVSKPLRVVVPIIGGYVVLTRCVDVLEGWQVASNHTVDDCLQVGGGCWVGFHHCDTFFGPSVAEQLLCARLAANDCEDLSLTAQGSNHGGGADVAGSTYDQYALHGYCALVNRFFPYQP